MGDSRVGKWGVPTSVGIKYFDSSSEASEYYDLTSDKGEPILTGPIIPPKNGEYLYYDNDPPGLWLMKKSGIPQFVRKVSGEPEAATLAKSGWPYPYFNGNKPLVRESETINNMPYKNNSDINPGKRKGMTSQGQTIYRKSFNKALKHYGNEATAHKVANSAVTKAGERKESKETGDFKKLVESISLSDNPIKPSTEPPTACEFWRGDGFCGVNALPCPHYASTFLQCKVRENALYASRMNNRM